MFAQARIITHNSEHALLLPTSAIQRLENKDFIFVRVELGSGGLVKRRAALASRPP